MESLHKHDFRHLLGRTKEEVNKELDERGIDHRTMREDKTDYMGTVDLRFDRLNLEYDNNKLTNFSIG